MKNLEKYFETFRRNIVGIDAAYESPYGWQRLVYADWVASGRLYGPIEDKIKNEFGPFMANTHTETSETGTRTTHAYHHAQELIKKHCNANPDDVIITAGSGMTRVVNKLQRILGLKLSGCMGSNCVDELEKPVVFITHMEHHSNHTSWFETICDVVILPPREDLLIDLDELRAHLKKHKDRRFKIGSFTAASNVTGIEPPYHEMAKIMHEFEGLCFVDFAMAAPYAEIDMHPKDPMEKLDAVFFSPHKFLGGPGASGVLIFDSNLYHCQAPDNPGGGTVHWTNPWGEYSYISDIEVREDGGTPGILQTIRAALAVELKGKMGVAHIRKREAELVKMAFKELRKIPRVNILADNVEDRLGCISFYGEDIHYNLIVKLLSDRFGIQVRGGCACAGTYGHYLLHVSYEQSKAISELIDLGDFSTKPGWIRLSLHPTMTDDELYYVLDAIKQIIANASQWEKDYHYDPHTNEYYHKHFAQKSKECAVSWFRL
ncbi:MAG: aminotransferase class V-fold PLP-dependent enzyme [Candidatus Aminicenantes bacterium]|nr:MAG: aminotransferase class V-fold PLP-dependent enzyme [Candidatus Aminicenantes bacterium]